MRAHGPGGRQRRGGGGGLGTGIYPSYTLLHCDHHAVVAERRKGTLRFALYLPWYWRWLCNNQTSEPRTLQCTDYPYTLYLSVLPSLLPWDGSTRRRLLQ